MRSVHEAQRFSLWCGGDSAGFISLGSTESDAFMTSLAPQHPLLVLGMHRCGTSALAGISTLLGATPPGSMIPAAPDNPTGFWESKPIIMANQALLEERGYNWFDCLPFDVRQVDEKARLAVLPRLQAVLRHIFGSARFFVVKDPRLSLMLDVWAPALDGSSALIAIRHPAEVAASLLRRNRCPAEAAHPIWLHYILEAEVQSRRYPRAVVSYDRFLRDWRGTMTRAGQQAGIEWPNPPATVAEDGTRGVHGKLRHHFAAPTRVDVGEPPLRQWMAQTWGLLRECETDGFNPARLRALDDIRSAFARWRQIARPRIINKATTA
jgi:hypothetical protein